MPFDANLVLINGSVTFIQTTDTPATTIARDANGAAVIDLGTTTQPRGNAEGVQWLTATLVVPVTPTTYADTLTAYIQQSDAITYGWERVASFPVLYAYTKLLHVTTTTPFVYTDIGTTLNGTTTGDDGVIRWFHQDLLGAAGATGFVVVTMVNATDDFDNATEAFTCGGAGAGTMNRMPVKATKARYDGPGTWTTGFSVTKKYIRANVTTTDGGSWGGLEVLLSPYPFKTL